MNAKRIEVYQSYTIVINTADAQALAPEKPIEPFVEGLAGVLVEYFGTDLVGFVHAQADGIIYVTVKHQNQAVELKHDWDLVMDLVMEHLKST